MNMQAGTKRYITVSLSICLLVGIVSGCDSPATEKIESELPYMDHDYAFVTLGEPTDPWEQYPFILDSVKKLTISDLTGEVTFVQDSPYSIIAANGAPEFAPMLPVEDASPPTGELYLAKTEAVRALKENDIIALAATDLYKSGMTVKIVKIHPTGADFSHLTVQCPLPEEQYEMDEFRKSISNHSQSSSDAFEDTSDADYSDWIPLTPNAAP